MVKKWRTYKVRVCTLYDGECQNGDRIDYKDSLISDCRNCEIYLAWKKRNKKGVINGKEKQM